MGHSRVKLHAQSAVAVFVVPLVEHQTLHNHRENKLEDDTQLEQTQLAQFVELSQQTERENEAYGENGHPVARIAPPALFEDVGEQSGQIVADEVGLGHCLPQDEHQVGQLHKRLGSSGDDQVR